MKIAKLAEMKGGWFVGDFSPAITNATAFEAAVKRYKAGDRDPAHVHRLTTEITVVVSGQVRMAGTTLDAGDIIMLEPNEPSGFEAITDCDIAVVRFPSLPGDKHMIEP